MRVVFLWFIIVMFSAVSFLAGCFVSVDVRDSEESPPEIVDSADSEVKSSKE